MVRQPGGAAGGNGSLRLGTWLPVRRFHVGTSAQTLTQDAGYTTATDSRVDLSTAFLFPRGRSPYTLLGVMAQTEFSLSAYFVAAAFSLSVAFAYGSEDCDWLICPLLEPLSSIAAVDPIDYVGIPTRVHG
jgi:hypothetical protein